MSADSKSLAGMPTPRDTRLEDFGFGSTLVAIGVAALAVFIPLDVPVLQRAVDLSGWVESCAGLISASWRIASAAVGLNG